MSNIQPKPYQWLAWAGTIGIIGTAFLAAINLYPIYVYGFILANLIWLIIGVLWREKSLIWMNLGLTLIYIIGLILKPVGA